MEQVLQFQIQNVTQMLQEQYIPKQDPCSCHCFNQDSTLDYIQMSLSDYMLLADNYNRLK